MVALAGQQGPILASLCGALLFKVGRPDLTLTATGIMGLFALLLALRSRTAVVIGAVFAAMSVVGVLAPLDTQSPVAGALIGFTAAAGVRLCWIDLCLPGGEASDEGVVSANSGVPLQAALWFQMVLCVTLFVIVAYTVLSQ